MVTQKAEVLAKAEYACLSDNADFVQLSNDIDMYSVDEITMKADLIFAAHMKSTMEFSVNENVENKNNVLGFNFNKKESKKSPYGNLFAKD